jgi:hypothetical protein
MVIMPVMWHVPRLSFTFLHLLFLKKKKKKNQNQDSKPIPIFFPNPFSPTHRHMVLPHWHRCDSSPFFSLVSILKWRAKKTQIRRTQVPKTHLCATSAKRWKERVERRFWMPATTPQPLFGIAGFALVSPPLLFSGSAIELLPHCEFHYFVPCSTF